MESEVKDVLARRRLRARSPARSSLSLAVSGELMLLLVVEALWWEGMVFDAAVMESSNLWNLRFEVAMASGMLAIDRERSLLFEKGKVGDEVYLYATLGRVTLWESGASFM